MRGLIWWIDRWRQSAAYTDLTLAEQGAYRNLLDEAWLRGGVLPDDERILAKACGDATAWPALRAAVLSRFRKSADGWRNPALDKVLAESRRRAKNQANYRAKQEGPGNGGGHSGGHVTDNVSGHVTRHVAADVIASQDQDQDQKKDPPHRSAGDLRARGREGRSVPRHLAFAGTVLNVPRWLDADFVSQLGATDFDLTAFYLGLDAQLATSGEAYDLSTIRDAFTAARPPVLRMVAHRRAIGPRPKERAPDQDARDQAAWLSFLAEGKAGQG